MHHLIRSFIAATFIVSMAPTSFAGPAEYDHVTSPIPNTTAPIIKSRVPHMHTNQIKAFLSKSYLLDEMSIEKSGYIAGMQEDTLIADAGKLIYGRNLEGRRGAIFDIVRPGETYKDYQTGKKLGITGRHVGTAVMLGGDDVKTLKIKTNIIEVMKGDRLIPTTNASIAKGIKHPRAARVNVSGHIIDIQDGVYEAGQYQIVTIDRGSRAGLKPGDILVVNTTARDVVDVWGKEKNISTGDPLSPQVVYTPHEEFIPNHRQQKGNLGGIKVDTTKEIITLPQEAAGHIMVYRTFDNVSYALVTDAIRSMSIGFPVYNP